MMTLSEELISLFKQKGLLNKKVTEAGARVFEQIRTLLPEFEKSLREQAGEGEERLRVKFNDRGEFEVELSVADDVILFILHTNAFTFDPSHPVLKSGYVTHDNSRATCAMISVYNFLSDSFRFDRRGDSGQLIGRIFINKEEHFFVEGKRQLGMLFNDFANTAATPEVLTTLIEACIIYSLDIDLTVPPIEAMREISVNDALAYNMQTNLNLGKRLGFKFRNEADNELEA